MLKSAARPTAGTIPPGRRRRQEPEPARAARLAHHHESPEVPGTARLHYVRESGTRRTPSLPPLDEATARANANALHHLGTQFGVSDLRFASPGRLIGHMDEDRDLGDMADFQLAIEEVLGKHAHFFTDGLIGKPGVSQDLISARPV